MKSVGNTNGQAFEKTRHLPPRHRYIPKMRHPLHQINNLTEGSQQVLKETKLYRISKPQEQKSIQYRIPRRRFTMGNCNRAKQFQSEHQNPAPGLYSSPSQFDKENSTKKGFSFGTNRNQTKFQDYLNAQKTPAPGQYQIAKNRYRNYAYSLRGRTYNPNDSTNFKQVGYLPKNMNQKHPIPGPGQYQSVGVNNISRNLQELNKKMAAQRRRRSFSVKSKTYLHKQHSSPPRNADKESVKLSTIQAGQLFKYKSESYQNFGKLKEQQENTQIRTSGNYKQEVQQTGRVLGKKTLNRQKLPFIDQNKSPKVDCKGSLNTEVWTEQNEIESKPQYKYSRSSRPTTAMIN